MLSILHEVLWYVVCPLAFSVVIVDISFWSPVVLYTIKAYNTTWWQRRSMTKRKWPNKNLRHMSSYLESRLRSLFEGLVISSPKYGCCGSNNGKIMPLWHSLISSLKKFRIAMFLHAVCPEGLKAYNTMTFEGKQTLQHILESFDQLSIGKLNETYERYIFNQTCNFRDLQDSLSVGKLVPNMRSC